MPRTQRPLEQREQRGEVPLARRLVVDGAAELFM
jgi:hypothetical protein